MKKIISVFLAITTLFCIFAVSASAASYSTGTYVINTKSGCNVRTGAGTGYNIVGAASNGVTFTVTKTSGSWGYTSSINCTNGKRSGWVCLDYCYKKSSSHTHNYNGGRYYEGDHPHAISVRCTDYNSCGGWKWTGEYYKVSTCTQCYPQTTYYTLTYNANGGSGAPSAQKAKADSSFYLSSAVPTRSGYTFLGWSTDKYASSSSYAPGIYVKIKSNVTLYAVWKTNSVNPTGISLNYSSITVDKGSNRTIYSTVSPSNASNKTVTWTSSDSSVATVSGGTIYGKAPGTATITAKTSNGKTATCKVTVKGITINASSTNWSSYLHSGDIYYIITSSYGVSSSKKYSTSNSSVLAVSSSGKITAKNAGTATITVKTSDGYSASYSYTVYSNTTVRTGRFSNRKDYTTVELNAGISSGSITIETYDKLGLRTNTNIHVTLCDSNGKWICEFNTTSGTKLNLGNDHSQYRVYVAEGYYNTDGSFWNAVINGGNNFINSGKSVTWKLTCKSNCYIR